MSRGVSVHKQIKSTMSMAIGSVGRGTTVVMHMLYKYGSRAIRTV